jgi:hypothetical protein
VTLVGRLGIEAEPELGFAALHVLLRRPVLCIIDDAQWRDRAEPDVRHRL